MGLLRPDPHRFIVFCDDLSFDGDDTSYKSLKAVLEGGIEGRPDNVIFYATSNRRHLLPRDMMENERSTAINPGEAVEEKVSLSDRFGLWLGFHKCSQDEYLDMVFAYVDHLGLAGDRDAIRARGARMGDDPRRALGTHGLAVHPGPRRAPRARRSERRLPYGTVPAPSVATASTPLRRRPRTWMAGTSPAMTSGRRSDATWISPLRCVIGSTGVWPLRISKWSCGEVTLPVWPEVAITWPRLTCLAALHAELAVMGVGRDVAVVVPDQDEVAVALHLAARIGDGAGLGGLHGRAFRDGDVDALVAAIGAEAGDDAAAGRPAEIAGEPLARRLLGLRSGGLGGLRLRSRLRTGDRRDGTRLDRLRLGRGPPPCGGFDRTGARRRRLPSAASALRHARTRPFEAFEACDRGLGLRCVDEPELRLCQPEPGAHRARRLAAARDLGRWRRGAVDRDRQTVPGDSGWHSQAVRVQDRARRNAVALRRSW